MYFKAKKNYKKKWMCPRCGLETGKRNMNNHFSSDPPCEPTFLDVSYEDIATDYDAYYDQCLAAMNGIAVNDTPTVDEPAGDEPAASEQQPQQPQQPRVDPLADRYARIPRSMLKAMAMDSIKGVDNYRLMNETKRIMEREYYDPDDRDFVTMPMSLLRVILLESLPNICKLRVSDEDDGNWNWIIVPFLRGSESTYVTHLRLLAILDSVTESMSDVQERARFFERVIALHFFKFGGLPGVPGAGDNPGANNNNNNNHGTSFNQSSRTRNGVPVD